MRALEQAAQGPRWGAPETMGRASPAGKVAFRLAPGSYLVTGKAPGCAAGHLNLRLKAGQARQQAELELREGKALVGSVRDVATGAPVGGALVTVAAAPSGPALEEEALTAVSDSLGRFRLEGLGPGGHAVRASAEGYADGATSVSVLLGDAEAVLLLEPAGVVEGVVRAAAPPATVRVLRERSRAVFANADGTFRLAASAGEHLLQGLDASGATALVRVVVPARGVLRGVELRLAPGGLVRGTASLGGLPARCARVWLRAESDPWEVASGHVDPDGAFTLTGLPKARYWLFAECPDGERGDVLGVEPDGPAPVEVTLQRTASLAIEVRDGAEQPVGGAEVSVEQPGREPVGGVTDESGRLELARLRPAIAEVAVKAGARRAAGRKVQLLEGQVASVSFTLEETGVVVGRVRGQRATARGVIAYSRDLGSTFARLEEDGSYHLELLPGRYKIFPRATDYRGIESAKEVAVQAGHQLRLDFELGAPVPEDALAASEPGTIGASFEDRPGGVEISWIISGGPADLAGLKEGDLLLAAGGEPLSRAAQAFALTRGSPGTPVELSYRRLGTDAAVLVRRAAGHGR